MGQKSVTCQHASDFEVVSEYGTIWSSKTIYQIIAYSREDFQKAIILDFGT